MSLSGVYMILNLMDGSRYVGSSKQRLGLRWSQHKCCLRHGQHGNPLLQQAWDRYGEESFRFVVLECPPEADRIAREQVWFDLFRTQQIPLYNIAPNAANHGDMRMPLEHVERMKELLRGKKHNVSPEGRARILAAVRRPRPDVSERFAKDWPALAGPDGTIYHIHNLLAFCKERGLNMSALRKVALGKRPSHKGFRAALQPDVPHPVR